VNIRNRFFVSLEGDFSPASYNFEDFARDQKINNLTFMLNIEVKTASKKFPVVIFGGIGVSVHQLFDLGYVDHLGEHVPIGDDTITVLALDLGIKIPISRKFLIRAEYQWNGNVYADYNDEYDEWDDTQWDFLSSSFSVGLEIHL
jgi:hypothetical protein